MYENIEDYEKNIKKYILEHSIDCKYFSFEKSCHSVKEASEAANVPETDFVKNICLIDNKNDLILTILKGEDRLDIKKIQNIVESKIRTATSSEILEKTGYPCGGVPSFGYTAKFIVDERVFEKEIIYTGGGTENSLIALPTKELKRVNDVIISNIRKII